MLTKVRIQNFKNLKYLELDLNHNHELRAPNGWGKSSIADAISWVLTGKLYDGSADHQSIKPKHDSRQIVDVELTFEDGTKVRKTYREVWTRTRGTDEENLTGHETTCYINDLEVPVSSFQAELLNALEIKYTGNWKGNILQLLIHPTFFGLKLPWQERRQIVTDLTGEVTDEDVFQAKAYLMPLKPYLAKAKGKTEDVRKLLLRRHRELSSAEVTLQAQIDILSTEVTVTEEKYRKAAEELERIDELIDDLKRKKHQTEEGAIAERNRQLAELQQQITQTKEADLSDYNTKIKEQQLELERIRQERAYVEAELRELQTKIQTLEQLKAKLAIERESVMRALRDLEDRRNRLLQEWKQVNEEQAPVYDSLICPNCGHDLNAEHIEAEIKAFNKNKAERLKVISEQGLDVKRQIEELEPKVDELQAEADQLHLEIEKLEEGISECNAKMIELNQKELEISKSIPEFKESPKTQELKVKYEELKNKPLDVQHNYDEQIEKLKETKKPHEEVITKYRAEQINLQKAQELEQQRKDVLSQQAEVEQLQVMLTDFIKTKLEILDSRIEAVFGDIKIRLIEANIKEGSWNEVCDVMDGQVPYHQTNSSQQIKLGIRVVEAIKRALGIDGLFYIIDNAEQITDRDFSKLTDAQTIAFVAYDSNDIIDIDIREDKPKPKNIPITDYNLFDIGS